MIKRRQLLNIPIIKYSNICTSVLVFSELVSQNKAIRVGSKLVIASKGCFILINDLFTRLKDHFVKTVVMTSAQRDSILAEWILATIR